MNRHLLANASPRPWTVQQNRPDGAHLTYTAEDGRELVVPRSAPANVALTAAAVNEYATFLEVEAYLRVQVEVGNTNDHVAQLLAQLDAIRGDFYLCFNCGTLTPEAAWTYWHRPLEEEERPGLEWVPARAGEGDPMCKCPACGWEHVDDDGNPGYLQGTRAEMEAERRTAAPEWRDTWAATRAETDAELWQLRYAGHAVEHAGLPVCECGAPECKEIPLPMAAWEFAGANGAARGPGGCDVMAVHPDHVQPYHEVLHRRDGYLGVFEKSGAG